MRIVLAALLFAGAVPPTAPAPAEAAQAAATRCGGALRPEADSESFAAGRDSAALARETGANFVAAASSLCGSGALRAADLAPSPGSSSATPRAMPIRSSMTMPSRGRTA